MTDTIAQRKSRGYERLTNERDKAIAERDEARRQLTEAQRAIDVLSNTVVAQDAEIKRMWRIIALRSHG